jgi:deoxycytidine triphosphate deaminase
MFKSGKFVSNHIKNSDDSTVDEERVTPHGVELTIDKIFETETHGVLNDEDYERPERKEAEKIDPGVYDTFVHSYRHITQSITEDDKIEQNNEEDKSGTYRINTLLGSNENIDVDSTYYALHPDRYVIKYNEQIEIPNDHIGFVFPRSRVVRSNANVTTGVWDAGYKGEGEGGLVVNAPLFVEESMPIAVMIMCRANTHNVYDGSHNNENIDEN